MGWLGGLARRAVRRLALQGKGLIVIAFVDRAAITTLHGRFLKRATPTDVLTFRYDRSASPRLRRNTRSPFEGRRVVIGEVVIAPSAARTYATRHQLPYRQELARYLVHGLLHWRGEDDRTPAQQRRMRVLENSLLKKP